MKLERERIKRDRGGGDRERHREGKNKKREAGGGQRKHREGKNKKRREGGRVRQIKGKQRDDG